VNAHWLLLNRGDVPGIVGKFLRDLWRFAGVRGMVIPRRVAGQFSVAPCFIEDWLLLDRVEPFAPVMTASAAPLVADLLRNRSGARLAAVLRPCEIRGLDELRRQSGQAVSQLVIVGLDCLGTYPSAIYRRRAEQEGLANLTTEVIERGRSDELPGEYFRPACRICLGAVIGSADVTLSITGPRSRELILIAARDGETARRLHLAEITDGEAPAQRVRDYQAWLTGRIERQARTRALSLAALSPDLPDSVRSLQAHLAACAPCRACLDACPHYHGEFSPADDGRALEQMQTWLSGCAQCGLCEDACPRGWPLTALFARLSQTERPA
jgi:formate dehydrogenase subunit beta